MKIKLGTLHRDPTCYGNKYWIQIEDFHGNDNRDLELLVNKEVTVVIDLGKPEYIPEPQPKDDNDDDPDEFFDSDRELSKD